MPTHRIAGTFDYERARERRQAMREDYAAPQAAEMVRVRCLSCGHETDAMVYAPLHPDGRYYLRCDPRAAGGCGRSGYFQRIAKLRDLPSN